jgi:hypothetical protein
LRLRPIQAKKCFGDPAARADDEADPIGNIGARFRPRLWWT